MSPLIASTTDGHIKVLSHSLMERWRLFESALEAADMPEVFPLPLSSDEFDKWISLSILIDSGVAYIEDYYLGDGHQNLAHEDYVRIVALMDLTCLHPSHPEEDVMCQESEWRLYCIPGTRGRVDRQLYYELGDLLCRDDDHLVPLEPMSLVMRENGSEEYYIFVALIYCEMLTKGCEACGETGLVMDPGLIDWDKLLDYDALQIEDEHLKLLRHADGYKTDEYDTRMLREDCVFWNYPFHLLYPYCIRYLYHAISSIDNWSELIAVENYLLGTDDESSDNLLWNVYVTHNDYRGCLASAVGEELASVAASCIDKVMEKKKELAKKRLL